MQKNSNSHSDLVGLRTAHLGMIQSVISRVSGFSATVKNFAVTVSVAMVAVAFDKHIPLPLWTGAAAIGAFLLMDGYYHLLEIRYRELYKATAKQPIDAGSDMLLDAPNPTWPNLRKLLFSKTLLPFYVLLWFTLGIALKEASNVGKAHSSAVGHSAGPGT